MKAKEDKRMVKLDFSQNCPFWTYIKKKSAHSLFGGWPFLLIHIRFTPSENWTMKSDHERWLSFPWSDFMVHCVNRPQEEGIFLDNAFMSFAIGLSPPLVFCFVPNLLGSPNGQDWNGSFARFDYLTLVYCIKTTLNWHVGSFISISKHQFFGF